MLASMCKHTLRQLKLRSQGCIAAWVLSDDCVPRCQTHNAGGTGDEAELLHKAVTSALQAAVDEKLPSLALPLISCGNFGCPVEKAAGIAVAAVLSSCNRWMSRCSSACRQGISVFLSCMLLVYHDRLPTHLPVAGSIHVSFGP